MKNSLTFRAKYLLAAFGLMGLLTVAACSTAPDSAEGKAALSTSSANALKQAEQSDPSLHKVITDAHGYAILPTVGKGAIGVGGAYGKGDVYEQGKLIGYCDMSQASIGFALGGQAYTEIIVFQTKDALTNFKSGKFTFDAQATAVALKSGAGANAKFSNGIAVFTFGESGLMYEASIGGQKFDFQAK